MSGTCPESVSDKVAPAPICNRPVPVTRLLTVNVPPWARIAPLWTTPLGAVMLAAPLNSPPVSTVSCPAAAPLVVPTSMLEVASRLKDLLPG